MGACAGCAEQGVWCGRPVGRAAGTFPPRALLRAFELIIHKSTFARVLWQIACLMGSFNRASF